MKVSELIAELEKAPRDMGVMIDCAGRLTEINRVGVELGPSRGQDQTSAILVLRGMLGSGQNGY